MNASPPGFQASLAALAGALTASGRGWALVGGIAVSARAVPRFTRDVDVAVDVADDAAAESLTRHLTYSGWRTVALIQQEHVGRLAQVLFSSATGSGVTAHVHFASSGIEPEIVRAADPVAVTPTSVLPVARTGHLIATTLLSVSHRRLQDRFDLQDLCGVADASERELTEESVALITERGFHRGRDLPTAAAELPWRAF